MSEEKVTVEMSKEDHEAFELFQNRRQRKLYLTEIKGKMPNTLGANVKNHVEKWLSDSLTTETLKLVCEQYNPLPVLPPPGRGLADLNRWVMPAAEGVDLDD